MTTNSPELKQHEPPASPDLPDDSLSPIRGLQDLPLDANYAVRLPLNAALWVFRINGGEHDIHQALSKLPRGTQIPPALCIATQDSLEEVVFALDDARMKELGWVRAQPAAPPRPTDEAISHTSATP